MLLRELKNIFHQELGALYPTEEVDSFFYRMLEQYLNLERFVLALQPQLTISKEEEQPFFEGLTRLKNEEPIQYILGEAYFMDLTLMVNENVLIPRPETEELVQWVISACTNQNSEIEILDVGTGSGCIAIALAKFFPKAMVYALDISEEALKVAEENAKSKAVEIQFIQEDILNPEFINENLKFDIIVSNPPYVRELEKDAIHNNVKKHEPQQALFVPDENPLKFYEAISQFATNHLKNDGKLFFEINQYLAEETESVLLKNGFNKVELRRDIFGNFRMLKGTKP